MWHRLKKYVLDYLKEYKLFSNMVTQLNFGKLLRIKPKVRVETPENDIIKSLEIEILL